MRQRVDPAELRRLAAAAATDTVTIEDLAGALRQFRRRHARRSGDAELTYREIAARTGWSHAVVGSYFTGQVLPPTDRLDALLRLLEVTPAELGVLATVRDRIDDRRRRRVAPSTAAPRPRPAAEPPLPRDPAGPPAPPPAAPVPRQLPADLPGFVGRARHLRVLDELTAGEGPAVPVAVISGMAGVGKTTLAVHWAHTVADRFPDGQLYVNLRGFHADATPLPVSAALTGFLEALAVAPERIPADEQGQAALFRSLLAGRRTLVVLDNVATAEQAIALLPGGSACAVVATSRNQLTGLVVRGARPVRVDLFTPAEARELLVARLGRQRLAADDRATRELIERSTRLPLVLSIVAARAATNPDLDLAVLATELRRARDSLDAFNGGDSVSDVRTAFSWSYRALGEPAGRLFRLLAVHPGPDLAAPAAASLAGVPVTRARALLGELSRAHLVTETGRGRYALHDLFRAYAAELVRREDDRCGDPAGSVRRTATARLLDHHLHAAFHATAMLEPLRNVPIPMDPPTAGVVVERFADAASAETWFAAERTVLVALVGIAERGGFDTAAWQLPWTLTAFLMRAGYWQDLLATQRTALAAAERIGDRTALAHTHRGMGRTYLIMARPEQARTHLLASLDGFVLLGDRAGQGWVHLNLGSVDGLRGQPAEALRHGQAALELFTAAGDGAGRAFALNQVGWYHAHCGAADTGLGFCQRALELHHEFGNRAGAGATLDSLGLIHHRRGDLAEAVRCFEAALDVADEIGDRFNEAQALHHLGEVHRTAGDERAAYQALAQALAILDELAHPYAVTVRARIAELTGAPSRS